MYYSSNYRPKKKPLGNKKVIIVIAAIIIVTTATILFGNYLKGKAEDSKANSSPMPDEVTVNEEELDIIDAAPKVSAYPLSLSELTSEKAEEMAEELEATGYTGVSLRLTDENGRPLYSSDTVNMFSSDNVGGDTSVTLPSLKEITAEFHKRGLRTVGCFGTANLYDDSASGEALRSYETALICELPSLGIDEAVIFGYDHESDNAVLLEYAEKVNSRVPDFTLGLAINLAEVKDAETTLQVLISKFDFLAVILDIPNDTELVYGSVEEQINGSTVVLTKYSPRLVMPYIDESITVEEILAINATHIDNWMIY